jgi:hypothetical protein
MFNRCEFVQKTPGKVVCLNCSNWMRSDSPEACFGECKKQTCVHLGEYLGDILVRCVTCRGNVRLKKSRHKCGVFGECVPDSRKVEADTKVHLCRGCRSFIAQADEPELQRK